MNILPGTHICNNIYLVPINTFTQKIRRKLELKKTGRLITSQKYNTFYIKDCSTPKFYGLLKLNKDRVSLSSIVASYSSPAFRLGKWLPTIFCPLMSIQTAYIKNSVDLAEKLKDHGIKKRYKSGQFRYYLYVYFLRY